MLPWWAGPAIFGAGVLVALALIVAGAARFGAPAMALQRRLETLKERPLDAIVERTAIQLATAQARIDALPSLLFRAQAALETIEVSRKQLTQAATTVNGMLGIARFLFSPPAKN
jgi:hypothetical protein